jgi:hypothetical protein
MLNTPVVSAPKPESENLSSYLFTESTERARPYITAHL